MIDATKCRLVEGRRHFDRFGTVIKAVLVAGIFAGLIIAAAQYVWTESIIDQAISVENARHAAEPGYAAGHRQEAPLVDRPTQKKGLFLGYGMYGIVWGLLFGIAYFIAQPWIVNRGRVGRALLLAAGSYWAVGLLPFLKYPANPPGVGDPSTLDYRLRLYLALLVLGVCIVMLAFSIRM